MSLDFRCIMGDRDWKFDMDKPETKFLFECMKGWGGGNNFFVATAAGKHLAGGRMADFPAAYREWLKLPESERRPGAVPVDPLPRSHNRPPEGALVLRAHIRPLQLDEKGRICREISASDRPREDVVEKDEPGRDHAWITEAECKAMIPSRPRAGEKFPVPESAVERLVRYHLIPTTGDVGSPWQAWKPEEVKSKSMWLTVEEASSAGVKLRLEGSARMERGKQEALRFFAPRVLGFLRTDAQRKKFDRFDVVAWGPCKDGRPWRTMAGVALERVGPESPAGGDRVPPHHSTGHREAAYLGGVR